MKSSLIRLMSFSLLLMASSGVLAEPTDGDTTPLATVERLDPIDFEELLILESVLPLSEDGDTLLKPTPDECEPGRGCNTDADCGSNGYCMPCVWEGFCMCRSP